METNPSHFDSIFYLASLSVQIKNFHAAKELFEKAIYIKPDFDIAYANLGAVLKELGKFKEAVSACEKAISIQPNNLGALRNLALALQELGEIEKAITCFSKLSKIETNPSNSYQNLGKLNVMLGNKKEAINFYQLAIKNDPENFSNYYNLFDLDKKILDVSLKKRIDKAVKENKYKKNLAYANFLLSKYESNVKNYKKEFNYLLKGHSCYLESQDKGYKNDIEYWLNVLPGNKELNSLRKLDSYNSILKNNVKPIFIVGVPRCGSTLVEKIIISGNQNVAAGEETGIISTFVKHKIIEKRKLYSDVKDVQTDIIKRFEEKNLIDQKNNYTFTDKTLDNFFYLGLIKTIFPQAKIINCKRKPTSSIISILKNNLPTVPWAHNLEHIFKYFDIYFRLIKNFDEAFPNFIYELELEQLSNEPEAESKKLMNFCNLPWDKKCLEFYKRKDLISKTASNIQIREAIYKHSLEKYLPYKEFLDKYAKKYSWLV